MKKTQKKIVAVSGGFDPIHIGHVRLLKAARGLGDELVVILNNDNWLRNKKGYVFMSERERKEILESLPFVDRVVVTAHKQGDIDTSVIHELKKIRPAIFANGGDRTEKNIPELEVCKKLGIQSVFNVGVGGKVQSSSLLTQDAWKQKVTVERPWGRFRNWSSGPTWNLKTIVVDPGGILSLQTHTKRDEMWIVVEGEVETVIGDTSNVRVRYPGDFIFVPRQCLHRISSVEGATLVEVSLGEHDELDITRYEDAYGRGNKKKKKK